MNKKGRGECIRLIFSAVLIVIRFIICYWEQVYIRGSFYLLFVVDVACNDNDLIVTTLYHKVCSCYNLDEVSFSHAAILTLTISVSYTACSLQNSNLSTYCHALPRSF